MINCSICQHDGFYHIYCEKHKPYRHEIIGKKVIIYKNILHPMNRVGEYYLGLDWLENYEEVIVITEEIPI